MPIAQYRLHENELRQMIEVDLLTQEEAAARLGIDRTTVQRWCTRFGLRTQRNGPRGGAGHPNWLGGRVIRKGYVYIHAPDHPNASKSRQVSEHRLVMEAKIGRYLDRKEVVHHVDGDPMNNHPDNLVLFGDNGDHLRHDLAGQTPNWSAEGRTRIAAGIRKAAAIHRHIKSDDDLRILSTDHPPS